MGRYAKAIAAAITGLVGLVAMFAPGVREFATPEAIAAVSTVVSTVLVYLVPNTFGGVNVNDLADATVEAWLDGPPEDDDEDPTGGPRAGLGLDAGSLSVLRR